MERQLGMTMGRVFSGTYPAPNVTMFNFNKRVWKFFLKPKTGSGITLVPPCPASIIYKFYSI